MEQHRYIRSDGSFDYAKYKDTQEAGNKLKLRSQWVDEATIKFLSAFVLDTVKSPAFGICHGTRRGLEQKWFADNIPHCAVIGTEISSTATQFPNTVQWDFHDENPEWVSRADFVYSNSWDHSYDPMKSFSTWLAQLRPGGVLILEHTRAHKAVTDLDPFGATIADLQEIATTLCGVDYELLPILSHQQGILVNNKKRIPAKYVIVRRKSK